MKIDDDFEKLNRIVSDGLYYRYTWTISAFITILLHRLNMHMEELPDNIRNLPSYIKFGLDNPTACLARSIGIKNRDTALLLSTKANGLAGRAFIRWVANLTTEDLEDFQTNRYDTQNILDTALKLNPNRYEVTQTSYNFNVRGIPYDEGRIKTSLTVTSGYKLTYERDIDNRYDPFAIKIFKDRRELGFVPREYSKLISIEIDLNRVEFEIVVVQVDTRKDYRNISVIMQVKH